MTLYDLNKNPLSFNEISLAIKVACTQSKVDYKEVVVYPSVGKDHQFEFVVIYDKGVLDGYIERTPFEYREFVEELVELIKKVL